MKYENSVKNMVESYLESPSKKGIFIKNYNLLNEMVSQIQEYLYDEDEDITYLYYEFVVGDIKGAYEPFLGWIKEIYNMHYKRLYTVEQFIELCEVYKMHKEVFIEYINTGVCKRREDVMIEEFEFECEQMLRSVYKIFDFISNSIELRFVISNIHIAPYSTLNLINYMMDKDDDIRFVFSYNDTFNTNDYIKSEWNKLISYAENNKMIPESNLYVNETYVDYQDEFIFDESKIKEYCAVTNNMYFLLTLEDANYYLSRIFDKICVRDSLIDDDSRLQLTSVYAMINLGMKEYNKALFICESMVPIYSKINNIMYEYYYNYLSALAHLMMIESGLATKFCDRCRELVDKMPENTRYSKEYCYMNILIIECLSRFGSLSEVFRCNYQFNAEEELLEKINEVKYENFLAYMYIFGFDNDEESVRQIAEGIKEPVYFNKGIEIAEKIGNVNLLQRAYMRNIVLYSEYGYHKYVRSMYEKRIAIIPKENKVRRAHSYSGMGYNSIVMEEYEEADRYFRNSIIILTEEKKAEDIAETLYNMALNYYLAGAYNMSVLCMETVLKIMELIGIEGVRICNTSKLYGIMALACYRQKKYYDVYFCLKKMESFLSHLINKAEFDSKLWEEDLILYYLTKAIMYQHEGNMEEADLNFESAYKYVQNFKGAKFYSIREYAIFRAEYYEKKDNQFMKHNVLREAHAYYEENRYPKTRNIIEALLDNKELVQENNFDEGVIDFERIIDVAASVGNKLNVQNKEKDIDFIMLCQDILVKENINTHLVINNIMNIIQNTFNIDKLFLIEKTLNEYTVSYSYGKEEIHAEDVKDVFDFISNHRVGFISNRIDKDYLVFRTVTDKFGSDDIATIIGIPIDKQGEIAKVFVGVIDIHRNFTTNRIMLKKNNLTVIKYVLNQLEEAVRRINSKKMLRLMNEKLKEVSVTDNLTGIYNRQGYSIVEREQQNNNGIIMYLDVDNFKYYNDTFGHNAGDSVLMRFARIIENCIGKEGKAIRYGDEFLAIIPETSEEEAKVMAQNIIDEFLQALSNTVGENAKVGCSIGIASYKAGDPNNMDIALRYADKALYYIKNSGKGNYAVWSEILE
ncbi:MAG: GGDEF domain-containing protein [Lachnospiraceae bacterium]|nr:GGDEF domain-containing protein [Lachnospiraceae bacterium]